MKRQIIRENGSDLLDYYSYDNSSSEEAEQDWCWSKAFYTLWKNGKWEIPLYSIIFLLAVIGNMLIILTLAKNSRMRTITNVFLLNLAVSDLILAVLCMPFTLIGTLLRDFIFGEWMCKLVPFLQATSVAVSVYTLVALSVERYYAICHPIRSRRWQTLSHAYHLISFIWMGGAVIMVPIGVLSELQPTNKGHHKCREKWPEGDYEKVYNLFLDILLLVIPLLALGVTYYLIATTLWKDSYVIQDCDKRKSCYNNSTSFFCQSKSKSHNEKEVVFISDNYDETTAMQNFTSCRNSIASYNKTFEKHKMGGFSKSGLTFSTSLEESTNEDAVTNPSRMSLRQHNYERSLMKKRRVIKMLCVVVLEFFICWTPLYVINTLALFWPNLVYASFGYKMISFCQLIAYTSGCCNPITYCFMNKGFRNSFISLFNCCKNKSISFKK